jgi:hypothetical protein
MPQEDLGSAIGGGQVGGAIGGAQVDLPPPLFDTTPAPVPPDTPPPVVVPPGESIPMYRVSSQQAGTENVAEGADFITVSGTFVVPYSPKIVTSWATDRWVVPTEKLTTAFTVRFTQLAPANSTMDWGTAGA